MQTVISTSAGRAELPGPNSQAEAGLCSSDRAELQRAFPSSNDHDRCCEGKRPSPSRMAHRIGQGSSAMESRADRYRRLATDDQLRALRTNDPSQKRAFEEAAREWLTLADDVERMEMLKVASADSGKLGGSRK